MHQKNLKLFCRSRDYIDYTFINFETDEYEIRLVVNHKSIITARISNTSTNDLGLKCFAEASYAWRTVLFPEIKNVTAHTL